MPEVSKPHSVLVDPHDKIANMRRWDERNVGDFWAREADFWEGLVEQLEAAQAEAELKRIETHHANAKRQSIEEQLEAVSHDRDLALESAKSNHAEKQRLKEQFEAAKTDLAEAWTLIWLEDSQYIEGGSRKLDAWAERMREKYGFNDDSFPATEAIDTPTNLAQSLSGGPFPASGPRNQSDSDTSGASSEGDDGDTWAGESSPASRQEGE